MEIPTEYFNEDKAAKLAEVDTIEASYNPDKFKEPGSYGDMKKSYS